MSSGADILGYIEHIASIAVAGAIIYTAWIGRSQLKEMRKEKLLDRRVKHAEKIVEMIHTAKEVISRSRSRNVNPEKRKKIEERLKGYGYSDREIEENEVLVLSLSASSYIRRERKVFLEISNYIPTSKIIFDSSITSNLNHLLTIYKNIAFRNYSRIIFRAKQEQKNFDDLLPIIRRRMDEDDIDNQVESIVEDIISKIQEIIGTADD